MSRIGRTFAAVKEQNKKALIPFITAGDPDLALTVPLMHEMVRAGADIIELGVPFSDPMADGPVIQRASERALKQGMTLKKVLVMVSEFRVSDNLTPVVLMGYANPIEAMGANVFVQAAQKAGVDGVLVVDYPPEECAAFAKLLHAAGIDPIFLLSPTSTETRFAQVAQVGSGYLYYVSLKGVTGAGHIDLNEVAVRIPQIRAAVGMPVGVGFGIRDAQSARRVAEFADAVVIGSRLIEEMENSPREQAVARVGDFLRGIRAAMDAAPVKAEVQI